MAAGEPQPRPTLLGLVRDLIATLPGPFLALLVVNLVFLAMLFWYEARLATIRADTINRLIDRCLIAPRADADGVMRLFASLPGSR